ncbi:glycosyltransferase family 4 protein [Rhodococcus pyridinivorans]|uniref:glycosyltransferase family 4 protein n=1 Tax=Rhodococcus pyridinivorans TaxID=103816 RepID=UPI00265AA7AC|nr:glycosyltransferase family 4 protein [Rhodococcus pyridinivorans]
MLKVAVVASSETPGGAEQYLYRLYAELRDRGDVEVRLIGSLPDWHSDLGVCVRAGVTKKLTRRSSLVKQGFDAALSVRKMLRAIDDFSPDLVHVQYFKEKLTLPRALARRGIPVMWTEHGPIPDNLPAIGRKLYAWQAQKCSVVAISQGVETSLRESGISSVLINNPLVGGVEFSRIPKGSSDGYVLFAGRLHEYKRVDLLLAAARKLPHLNFVIAGDGPDRVRLEGLAPANVKFLGGVNEMSAVYAGAGLVVIPSGKKAREGSPMVMLEARSGGIDVLMARDCHAAEEASSLGCYLFDPEAGSLTEEIMRALASTPRKMPSEIRAARSLPAWADQHRKVMESAVGVIGL